MLGTTAILLISGTLAIFMPTMDENMIAAYPRQDGYHHYDRMGLEPGQYAAGTIASLQNDERG